MLASLPLRQVAREMAQEADEALCSVEVDSGGSNTLGSCAPTAVRSRKRTLADAPTPSEIFPPRPLPEHLRTDSSQLESAVFRQFHRKTSHRLDDPFDEDFYRHETELTTHNTCERLNSDIRPRTHSVQTVAVAAMAGAAVAAATVAVASIASKALEVISGLYLSYIARCRACIGSLVLRRSASVEVDDSLRKSLLAEGGSASEAEVESLAVGSDHDQ